MANPTQPAPAVLKGYNLLANLMAEQSDLAIYRRFMAAHHFDLMLQQAEINYLLQELAEDKNRDIWQTSDNASTYDTIFLNLMESSNGTADDRPQWPKLMAIRQKLKEHGDHLLQVQSLINLPSHNKDDYNVLQRWFLHEEGGNDFLQGVEHKVWSSITAYDLTSLNGHGSYSDPLSRFLEGRVFHWINEKGLYKLKDQYMTVIDPYLSAAEEKRRKNLQVSPSTGASPTAPTTLPLPPSLSSSYPVPPTPTTTPIPPIALAQTNTRLDVYSSTAIRTGVTILSTTLSSLLPTMSIFVLYFVQTQLVRLGLILVFTALFSAVFASVARARRAEGFAAAAAFAAVLVVFVSGNVDQNSGNNCCTSGGSGSGSGSGSG